MLFFRSPLAARYRIRVPRCELPFPDREWPLCLFGEVLSCFLTYAFQHGVDLGYANRSGSHTGHPSGQADFFALPYVQGEAQS